MNRQTIEVLVFVAALFFAHNYKGIEIPGIDSGPRATTKEAFNLLADRIEADTNRDQSKWTYSPSEFKKLASFTWSRACSDLAKDPEMVKIQREFAQHLQKFEDNNEGHKFDKPYVDKFLVSLREFANGL